MGRLITTKLLWRLLFAGIFLSLSAWPAHAAMYGDFEGSTVLFNNVYETTNTSGDPDGLFGGVLGPTVVGDQLLFFPTEFLSESEDGPTSDQTSSLLQVTLVAKPGHTIDRIRIQEIGDYLVQGTDASAQISALLTVSDLAGPNGSLVDFWEAQYPGNGSGYFNGVVDVVLTQPTTMVQITLNNNLGTSSNVGSSALIQKKVVNGPAITMSVNPVPVPVPAAIWLLASGLGLVLWRGRTVSSGRNIDH